MSEDKLDPSPQASNPTWSAENILQMDHPEKKSWTCPATTLRRGKSGLRCSKAINCAKDGKGAATRRLKLIKDILAKAETDSPRSPRMPDEALEKLAELCLKFCGSHNEDACSSYKEVKETVVIGWQLMLSEARREASEERNFLYGESAGESAQDTAKKDTVEDEGTDLGTVAPITEEMEDEKDGSWLTNDPTSHTGR